MEPVQGNRKVTATGSHRRRDRASGLPPAKPPSGPQRLQGSAQREPGGIRAQNSKVIQVQGGGAAQESGHRPAEHQPSRWSGPCREALGSLYTSSAPAQSPGDPRSSPPSPGPQLPLEGVGRSSAPSQPSFR